MEFESGNSKWKKKIDFQQHSKSGTKIYEELGKEAKEAEWLNGEWWASAGGVGGLDRCQHRQGWGSALK